MTKTFRVWPAMLALVAVVSGALAVTFATSSTAAETTLTSYITGYSYYDNDPPGSAQIAFPKSSTSPTLHTVAAGTGTYADPITLAVGVVNGAPLYAPGTRFYIPNLRRYLMVEDTCASCATDVPTGATRHLDLWVDGSTTTLAASDSCMNAITRNSKTIQNPVSTYAVVSGSISKANGCTTQFGDTVAYATPPATTTVAPTTTRTVAPTTTKAVAPTTASTTAARATSLSCPVVTSPVAGQTVSCTYR